MVTMITKSIIIIIFTSTLLFYICGLCIFYYYGPYLTQKTKALLSKYEGRIVVSLTTTPYRINKLEKTLESLKQQSIQPNAVYINIPHTFAREEIPYIIPDKLANDPFISLVRDYDYGPATKLLPTLKQETDPNTIIITVDDDHIYHKQVLRNLTLNILSYSQTAITNIPYSMYYKAQDTQSPLKEDPARIVQSDLVLGFSGVAYKRSFFGETFWPFMADNNLACYLSDDLMIAIYLKQQGIAMHSPPYPHIQQLLFSIFSQRLPQAHTLDALSIGATNLTALHPSTAEGSYSQCLMSLLKNSEKKLYATTYINSLPNRASNHKFTFLEIFLPGH